VIYKIAQRLAIVDAVGNDCQGELALWQVITRIKTFLGQDSPNVCDCFYEDLNKGFTEEELYKNLTRLDQNQASIEDQIFNKQFSDLVQNDIIAELIHERYKDSSVELSL